MIRSTRVSTLTRECWLSSYCLIVGTLLIVYSFRPIEVNGHDVERNNVDPLSNHRTDARTGSPEFTVHQLLDVRPGLSDNVQNNHPVVVW